jgi:putative transposase
MGANGSGLPATRYCGFLIVDLYHRSRLHLSLDKDSPDSRPVHSLGEIIGLPEVGGLHHRYERRVA